MSRLTPERLRALRAMATEKVTIAGREVPLEGGVLGITPETLLALLDSIAELEAKLALLAHATTGGTS